MVVWGGFLSWIIVGSLAARDKHELREHLTKTCTTLFAYTFLDDIISGVGALIINRSSQKSGVTTVERGRLGFPKALSLARVLEQAGDTSHWVYKQAKKTCGQVWLAQLFSQGQQPL